MASFTTQKTSTFTGLTKGGSLAQFDSRVSSPILEKKLVVPAWKRVLDLSVLILTLPMWLPLMIMIGVWIKVCSRGPVFFCQERVGLGTRLFTILKFRTMNAGVETKSHENHF